MTGATLRTSRPVGTVSSVSDVTDEPNESSKPQSSSGHGPLLQGRVKLACATDRLSSVERFGTLVLAEPRANRPDASV